MWQAAGMRTPSCPPRPRAAPLLRSLALVALLGAPPLLAAARAGASGPSVVEPLSVSALAAAIAEYDRGAQLPLPRLTDAQRTSLIRGEVVRVLDQPGGDPNEPRRATGLRVIPAPRDVVWVACQDPHYVQSGEVTEVRVEFAPPDRSRWYGLLDLPRPFADRHWLVDVTNNHSLAASSSNRAWEHPWRLRAGGEAELGPLVAAGRLAKIPPEQVAEAVWTPVNHGAWLVIALDPEHTLLGYHATSVVGGAIPEGLITRFVHATLGGMLEAVAERAVHKVRAHYVAGHKAVIGGDGRPVGHFGG